VPVLRLRVAQLLPEAAHVVRVPARQLHRVVLARAIVAFSSGVVIIIIIVTISNEWRQANGAEIIGRRQRRFHGFVAVRIEATRQADEASLASDKLSSDLLQPAEPMQQPSTARVGVGKGSVGVGVDLFG
jgi:hypothetical protein